MNFYRPAAFGFVRRVFLLALWFAAASASRAVILYRTADPTANTTAPTGDLANSGWQFEGIWGGFLGTPIAPQFFLSAKHVGQAGGSVFTFGGVNYTVAQGFADPNSDLNLWKIAETFPGFAPLYTKADEVGKPVVAIGRGTQRGSGITVNGNPAGWNWGAGDGVERWGENTVSDIFVLSPDDDFIYCAFDQNGLTNEAHLSSGDSGGAAFIEDGDVWKLAGIHYAVDGPFYTAPDASTAFNAALFDTRGLYYSDGANPPNFFLITGNAPVPSGFYPTRVSTKLGWIYSVTDSLGDVDADGIPNLLEYALHTNAIVPDTNWLPFASVDGTSVSLTYTKVTTATDVTYSVEQSSDLANWTTANPTIQIIATQDNVQTIKASVAKEASTQLFLRLRVTRPNEPLQKRGRFGPAQVSLPNLEGEFPAGKSR